MVFTGVSSDGSATHATMRLQATAQLIPKTFDRSERPSHGRGGVVEQHELAKAQRSLRRVVVAELVPPGRLEVVLFFVIEMSRMSWALYILLLT